MKIPDGCEPEFCDDCGALVGYCDPSLPEGEKIVVTLECRCIRDAREIRKRARADYRINPEVGA